MSPRPSFGSNRCQVCRHRDRALIEAARIAGVGLDAVAARYAVSRDSLWRHMAKHVPEDIRAQYIAAVPLKELAEKAASEGISLLGYLSIMRTVLMTQFQLAASLNDRSGTAAVAGRLTEVLREIGRLTGELLNSTAVTNISNTAIFVNSPVFVELQAMLIEKLARHPEALSAVVAGLEELERRTVAPKTIEHRADAAAA